MKIRVDTGLRELKLPHLCCLSPPPPPPGVTDGPSNEVTDRPLDPGPEDDYGADIEGESLSESAAPPRRSQ